MKKRTITQISILLLFFIVPLLDIFRIDLVDLHFYVLRQRFSFSDGLILLLTVLLLVFTFVSIAQWFGRQFCGWMCPHNTFSGYLTKITHSKRLKENKSLCTAIDVALSIMFAPLIGFSMIAYFYNPSDLLHEIINLDTSAWSLWAYSITSVFFFVMINRLRHHFCRNACPYGMLQMILSDKNSRKGGVRNMFRGAGLALTILMMVLASFLLFAIYTNIGFAISIGKNLQGVPVQDRIIYTYNLQIENLKNKPAVFHINYENIPAAWNLKIPEEAPNEVKTGPNSTMSIPLLFRVDQASIGQSNTITVKIANEDGKEIARQINIFPVKK